MKVRASLLCCALVLAANVAFAEETEPSEIFKKVHAAYAELQTYSSQGTIIMTVSSPGVTLIMKKNFSIKMKKPNQYLVTWDERATAPKPQDLGSGVIWSDGTQPFYYFATSKQWFKAKDDHYAFVFGLASSSGAPELVPRLFISTLNPSFSPFESLANPKLAKSEKIAGEECYVVGQQSRRFKRETHWISKSTFLIRQYSHLTEPADQLLEENVGKQVDADLKKSGQSVSEDQRADLKKAAMERLKEHEKNRMKGPATAVYAKIDTPDFTDADFIFKPPASAEFKE